MIGACAVFVSALVQVSWARATDFNKYPSMDCRDGGPEEVCVERAGDGELSCESWEVHVGLLQTDIAVSRTQRRTEHLKPLLGGDGLDHWLDELFEAEPEGSHFLLTTLRLLGIIASGYAVMAGAHAWVVYTTPSGAARTKWQLQIEVYCDSWIAGMTSTSMAPLALPLSHDLGHGAQFSGLMMSSLAMLTALGAGLGSFMAPRLSPQSKRCLIAFLLACATFSLTIQGLVSHGFSFFATLPRRDVVFIAARVFQGFVYFMWVSLLFGVTAEVCQPPLRVRQQLYQNLALMVGNGSGPFVVAILTSSSENSEAASFGLAAPIYASAAFYAFHTVAAWMVVPTTPEAVAAAAEDTCGMELVAADGQASVDRCLPDVMPCDQRSLFLRKLLYCFGNLYGVERAVVTISLEAATSFVLETHFGWATSRIGTWIGIVYLLGTLVAWPLTVFKDYIGELLLMKIGSSTAVIGSVLLAIFIHRAEYVVLLADFLLFSACFVGSGIAEGLALAAAIPESSWFNLENYWSFSNIMKHNVGRFFAPLMVRSTIGSSTALYGAAQVSLTAVGFVLCHAVAYTVHGLKSQGTAKTLEGDDAPLESWDTTPDTASTKALSSEAS
mmetsp:Transcript_45260/g.107710  ORF Transcript_45260/g.107710 Transcript_45260/m.107710 type:complete len:612 (+) Transcript_45260:95-1930(+)